MYIFYNSGSGSFNISLLHTFFLLISCISFVFWRTNITFYSYVCALILFMGKEVTKMTNFEFLAELKQCTCYNNYIEYLGEHGHGHYHTSSIPR